MWIRGSVVQVVKVGKSIGVTECDIRRLDGTIVAQGKHTKFFILAPPVTKKQQAPAPASKL
jgi:hypothetical protein